MIYICLGVAVAAYFVGYLVGKGGEKQRSLSLFLEQHRQNEEKLNVYMKDIGETRQKYAKLREGINNTLSVDDVNKLLSTYGDGQSS